MQHGIGRLEERGIGCGAANVKAQIGDADRMRHQYDGTTIRSYWTPAHSPKFRHPCESSQYLGGSR